MSVLAPGAVLGGCRVEGVVGKGGMGVVYLARQLELERDVALKVISPELTEDPLARARFLAEARAAAAVEHPNVVPVHVVGTEDDRAYLVMRFIRGDDLRALVRRVGPLPPERAAAIAERLGDALDAIHRAGYVHRDVKPPNVLIDDDEHVYLSDFGLAKAALATRGPTTEDHWVGTLDYVAPEQIRGEPVDARTDVYALGGVLHFMLTGQPPFDRDGDEAKLWAHLHDEPPRPSAHAPVLPAFDAIVVRALAKDPADRQASAGELGTAALAAARGEDVAAPTVTAPRPRKRQTPPILAGLAGLACAAGGALVALALSGDDSHSPAAATPRPTPTVAAERPMSRGQRFRVADTHWDVGAHPHRVVIASGIAWMISDSPARITALDVDTGEQVDVARVPGQPLDITTNGRKVWVAHNLPRGVERFDARTGELERSFRPPGQPWHIAIVRGRLWVATREDEGEAADLHRYTPDGRGPLHTIPIKENITAMTIGNGDLWLSTWERQPTLLRVHRDALDRVMELPSLVQRLSNARKHLWAATDDSIVKIDPVAKTIVEVPVGDAPVAPAVSGKYVLIGRQSGSSVLVLEARDLIDGHRLKVPVPRGTFALTAENSRVWVTGFGTLTELVRFYN